jgi:hypothetical protein
MEYKAELPTITIPMAGLSYKHMLISTALEYLEKIISVHHSTSIWKQHVPTTWDTKFIPTLKTQT